MENTAAFTLNDNTQMPKIGLGTYNVHEPEEIVKAVRDIGYRMLDTASFYKNEECVGKAMAQLFQDKVVERQDLYVVSKVWHDEVQDVQAACERSLQKLGIKQLDLYLIHWPIAVKTLKEATDDSPAVYEKIKMPMHKVWPQMESLVR